MKKNIMFIIPTLTQGGAERVVVTLLNNLSKDDFDLSILVVNMKDDIYSEELPPEINLINLKCGRVRYALPKIILSIWRNKPDIVFSTIGYLNLAMAILIPVMPRSVRFVARETIVVSEGLSRVRFPRLWKIWYRYLYPSFDKVICQSKDMLTDLVSITGNCQNLVLINNPIDYKRVRKIMIINEPSTADFFNDESKTTFVAAGRLTSQKGFELLIKAVALTQNPNIKLAILGDGPLKESLQTLIQSLNLDKNVILMGFQSNPYAWISRADAFILSSYYEGFPNVILEALACGTPVISTPAPGGCQEILGDIQGCYLADNITATSLSESITLFIESPKVIMKESVVAPYGVQKIVQQYQHIFSDL